jgi:hypothetical protein
MSLPGQHGDPRVERILMLIKHQTHSFHIRRTGTTDSRVVVVVVDGLSPSTSRAQHSKNNWLVDFAFAEHLRRHPLQLLFLWLGVSTPF